MLHKNSDAEGVLINQIRTLKVERISGGRELAAGSIRGYKVVHLEGGYEIDTWEDTLRWDIRSVGDTGFSCGIRGTEIHVDDLVEVVIDDLGRMVCPNLQYPGKGD